MILSNEIAEMWDIEQTDPKHPLAEDYPFMLVCHRNECADMGYPCRTVEEARQRLAQVALKAHEAGHQMVLV